MKTKIGVVSLGCDKNRVDTEVMLANLVAGGYQITASPADADVIIVNTCAFLESARQEAIETALEMAQYKQEGKCQKVILTGCLGQKFGDELLDGFSEVDAIVGTGEYDNICDIVQKTLAGNRALYNGCNALTFGDRILTTPAHTAYLKIADGCNNFCTYCLIPYIRGRFRSVPMEQVVQHAKQLAQSGVKEIILVAQDTTRYGKDLYGSPRIVELVNQIAQIEGIEWIRLLYCYPELMDDALINLIATNPKVVKYVDIPLQHVNDAILKGMNRKSTKQGIVALFDKLRQQGIAVRSTFICGFPGETKQTVAELEQFITRYPIRNVGFFAYSKEEGTVAARMENQVAKRSKDSYVKRLYATQYQVQSSLLQQDVGKTYRCIVEEQVDFDGDFYTYRGRTEFMAPDIDGCVYVSSRTPLLFGNFYDVKITCVLEYDLCGEVQL